MTTSGDITYDRTGAQIAEAAARLIRIIGVDETLDTTAGGQEDQALELLNLMIKTDQSRLGLWRRREAKLFVVPSQASYDLPGANACDISELAETTLDATEAASQTVISVTSTTGFANSDVIGIILDDDTIHWTTIVSFVTDDTVTITTGIASQATSGNKVYVYTTAAPRPLKIKSMRREQSSQETPMFDLSHDEYFDLPNKDSDGQSVEFYYDPQRPTGKVYLWPRPSTVADEINYTYLDGLEVITANTQTADYPEEWMEYLVYGLAVRLAPLYGVAVSQEVLATYTKAEDALEGNDTESATVQFEVAR